jgi:hypothetical protein
MATLLLYERTRGATSPVSGYITQLPLTIDTPIRWSSTELAELQYPALQDAVATQQEQWRRHHADFLAAAGPDAPTDWDSFLWALENVRSRSFSGPYAGAPLGERAVAAALVVAAGGAYVAIQHVPIVQALNGLIAAGIFNIMYDLLLSQKLKWYAMCPVIDAVNHDSGVTSAIEYEYFRNSFAASVTSRGFQPGEQVFISYGPQSNSSLMQYYGFTEDGNPNDIYVFDATLDGAPSAATIRVTITAKGGFSPETLAEAGSAGNVRQLLAHAVERELAAKPTTLAEDERAMATPHLMSDRAQAATAFRIQKKKLLEKCIRKAKKKAAKS